MILMLRVSPCMKWRLTICRALDKLIADQTITLYCSNRLANKEGPAFTDMTTKEFDLSAASFGLAAAIDAAGLVAALETPNDDVQALVSIAMKCGTMAEDVREISSVPRDSP